MDVTTLLNPTVKAYVAQTLTEKQQLFLSKEITTKPMNIPAFFLSKEGQIALHALVDSYIAYIEAMKR